MTFTSQLIVERSELGSRASVKEQGERTASAQGTPPLLALGRRLWTLTLSGFSRRLSNS